MGKFERFFEDFVAPIIMICLVVYLIVKFAK